MEKEYSPAPCFSYWVRCSRGAVKLLLKKIRKSITVGLFCFGLLVGVLFAWRFQTRPLERAVYRRVTSILTCLLYVFLPVLIFSAAYELDLHTFRRPL